MESRIDASHSGDAGGPGRPSSPFSNRSVDDPRGPPAPPVSPAPSNLRGGRRIEVERVTQELPSPIGPVGAGESPEESGGPLAGPLAAAPGVTTATLAGARTPEDGPPTLLYIVGHHKSGSTFLGAVLAEDPEIYFAGELYRFPRPIWVPGDPHRLCSCGASVLSCPFWSGVRSDFEQHHRLEELRDGQRRFDRLRGLPGLLLQEGSPPAPLARYVRSMEDLAGILARRSGRRLIVEASFSAARARVYHLADPARLRVKYLHLVRDGRAFLWSEMRVKEPPEDGSWWLRLPPFVVARWVAMNLLALTLCSLDRERYLRIRYEELVTSPRATIERIGRFLGRDLSQVAAKVEERAPIPLRHVAAGNWRRGEGSVVLRPDFGWETGLSARSRALFWLASGWLATLLGYSRRRRRSTTGPAARGPR